MVYQIQDLCRKKCKKGIFSDVQWWKKFQPIFQILHIKSAWFLLELAMALVTTIWMRFLQVCLPSSASVGPMQWCLFRWLLTRSDEILLDFASVQALRDYIVHFSPQSSYSGPPDVWGRGDISPPIFWDTLYKLTIIQGKRVCIHWCHYIIATSLFYYMLPVC